MIDRRTFLRHSALLGVAGVGAPGWGAPWVHLRGERDHDLVLRGAVVFDGGGAAGVEADVAVDGDRITAVGEVAGRGATELDLRGLALAPGFVDIHSHADLNLLIEPRAESRIRQGITTEVVGQDGSSILYSDDARRERNAEWLDRYGIPFDFDDIASFLDRVDRTTPAVNLASMVGHGTIRGAVVGYADRPATPSEIDRMRAAAREALAQGAVGISAGLEYTPGAFATTAELAALAGVLGGAPDDRPGASRPSRSRFLFAAHMRNEDDRLLAAIEEVLTIGRTAGVPVHLSHLKAQGQRNWWKAEIALQMIDRAVADGIDVTFDRYPYLAYATGLTSLFPAWSREGGTPRLFERLDDPAEGQRIREAVAAKVALLGAWDAVQITSAPATAWAVGARLGALARERRSDPFELVVRLLRENRGGVGMVGFGMSEENTARFLAHPRAIVASDGGAYAPYGPLSTTSPHPRGYGTFPRVLGHHVRERGDLGLAEAIGKMTSAPWRRAIEPQAGDRAVEGAAATRGVVRPGAFADLVALDPATVADRATFDDPHRYPVGIPHVVVNGVLTLRDGEQTGERGGRAIRGAAARGRREA
ncbi:MAG: amidohydrolase family protein [Longimicrobiales bacterium]|nr:amidohydrolase family protein [Longimicrobiales bacterium]